MTAKLLGMVNEIACKEYGIPTVPLKFDGVTDLQTAAEYNLESRDIYVNLDRALKRDEENVGIASVIGTLVHECTHAWHHQLTINPDVPKPPGWRDAEAILDFNLKNYARPAMVEPRMYQRQPTERHAHASGFAVQRNIEQSLGSKVNNLSDTPMSETRRLLVAGWAQSATNPNPRVFARGRARGDGDGIAFFGHPAPAALGGEVMSLAVLQGKFWLEGKLCRRGKRSARLRPMDTARANTHRRRQHSFARQLGLEGSSARCRPPETSCWTLHSFQTPIRASEFKIGATI